MHLAKFYFSDRQYFANIFLFLEFNNYLFDSTDTEYFKLQRVTWPGKTLPYIELSKNRLSMWESNPNPLKK